MRRWNGWGDETIDYPLPDSAQDYLNDVLGPGVQYKDADYTSVTAALPPSVLPEHSLLIRDPDVRLRHARGQSLLDWVALRTGRFDAVPDAVAFPESAEEVRALLHYAIQHGVQLIPYGGGTSVVGHINPLPEFGPALTVSSRRMNQLIDLDAESHLATFGAGVSGPEIEAQLGKHGFVLGHFPQSWEFSTLGGWIATRSSGQQSYYYGRVDDFMRGASLETPSGSLNLPVQPASAAGPDLRQSILGSEGRMGMITQATVRVRKVAEFEDFYGAFFPDWESGVTAARSIAQQRVRLSMLRLSDSQETETTLALIGHDRIINLADRGLQILGQGPERCLMIYGVTGDPIEVRETHARAKDIFRAHGGLPIGKYIGQTWERSRFRSPYLRNTLWEKGYALDTLETAVPWARFHELRPAVISSIKQIFNAKSIHILVFSHLSHLYEDGVSLYVTYLYPRQPDAEQTLEVWKEAKHAASEEIVSMEGTISHQHGVGFDHRRYLEFEKGKAGVEALRSFLRALDPDQILNPGKLLPERED